MRRRGGLFPFALTISLIGGSALAGAWPTPQGETLAILKYERSVADEGFDPQGSLTPIPQRTDDAVSLFVEHGLTDRLTLQGKGSWTRGDDPFVQYSGRGPLEIGLRYAVVEAPRTVVSVYAGLAYGGVGRNAGYAAPGIGTTDYEARLLVGRSGRLRKRPLFGELQLARIVRDGLPNESRLDATVGWEVTPRWLLMSQIYAGEADGAVVRPRWVKEEVSATRRFDRWRLQVGWRWSVAGRESPAEQGPVLAVWRLF